MVSVAELLNEKPAGRRNLKYVSPPVTGYEFTIFSLITIVPMGV